MSNNNSGATGASIAAIGIGAKLIYNVVNALAATTSAPAPAPPLSEEAVAKAQMTAMVQTVTKEGSERQYDHQTTDDMTQKVLDFSKAHFTGTPSDMPWVRMYAEIARQAGLPENMSDQSLQADFPDLTRNLQAELDGHSYKLAFMPAGGDLTAILASPAVAPTGVVMHP